MMTLHSEPSTSSLTFQRLLTFFIPLGVSSSLVMISHVIINSTLARSAYPELVIASYSIAASLMSMTERPAVLLRQTCSALVRDRISFRAMRDITIFVLFALSMFGLIVSYTPLGQWIFSQLFGVPDNRLQDTLLSYRILMFVSIFSGIRCLYHGIIIFNLRTKWLTIGMVIRLVGMYGVAAFFIYTDRVSSGAVGAIIFLTGMIIECAVSVFEGRSLVKKVIPEKMPDHPIIHKNQIFRFYKPLMYSSFLAVIIGPSINAFLGKTTNIELAIASYAIALSLAQLMQSFFSYIHQIVLNFYRVDARKVKLFALMIGFIPAILIAILAYTSAGPWVLQHIMGIRPDSPLMAESLSALRFFMIMNLIFPWLDFSNGLIMLLDETRAMVWSQAANVAVTLTTLVILITVTPGWNGAIGALALSLGLLGELTVIVFAVRRAMTARTRMGVTNSGGFSA